MSGERVLLVDDEPAHTQPVKLFLTRRGLAVTVAHEAEEARARLAREAFDLVVLDLNLTAAGNEGLQLLRSIRAKSASPPVIILSAHVGPEVTELARLAGADVVLSKPQGLPELYDIAQRLLGSALC